MPQFEWLEGFEIGQRFRPPVRTAIIPLVGPGWTPKQPVHVFLKTYGDWVPEISKTLTTGVRRTPQRLLNRLSFSRDKDGNARLTLRGRLRESDFPTTLTRHFAEHGLVMARPFYILDQIFL